MPPLFPLAQRRELFVDHLLIDRMDGLSLQLQTPVDRGVALNFDGPYEGAFSTFATVLEDGDRYRLYYRGKLPEPQDGFQEVTCVAESDDGIHWNRPELGIVQIDGSVTNHLIPPSPSRFSHNFSPMIDRNPAAPAGERFKAFGGKKKDGGLTLFVSSDGLRWRKFQEEPVIQVGSDPLIVAATNKFDSQNVLFWSEHEQCYLAYFRLWFDGLRRIGRAQSDDLIHWHRFELMEYRDGHGNPCAVEEFYINQTAPYFRAPHLYIGTAARFLAGRKVLDETQAAALKVSPQHTQGVSDTVLLTSRGGNVYQRTFPEALVRPGLRLNNWSARSGFPALNAVRTGPAEMSFYLGQHYGQPTAHLRRFSLRLDGFGALHAPWAGGEMVTHPLTFEGTALELNVSTSAAGSVKVEIQDGEGHPIPGLDLESCEGIVGDEVARVVCWKASEKLAALAGKPVRLRWVMKDADLFSFRFRDTSSRSDGQ